MRHQFFQLLDLLRLKYVRGLAAAEQVVVAAVDHGIQHTRFVGRSGIANHHFEHEAVELGFGQRIGAFLLNRVLRGQHHKGAGQMMGVAVERYAALLHHFEQSRLGFGRGTVDFVGEQQVGEHRTLAQLEAAVLRIVAIVAGNVGWHQVGRELDAAEFTGEGLCQRAHEQGFTGARYAFEQHMAASQEYSEHFVHHLLLADKHFVQPRAQHLDGAHTLLDGGVGAGLVGLGKIDVRHRIILLRCLFRWLIGGLGFR